MKKTWDRVLLFLYISCFAFPGYIWLSEIIPTKTKIYITLGSVVGLVVTFALQWKIEEYYDEDEPEDERTD